MLGSTLGRYRVLSSLGEGGMGQVFLAEDPVLARRVAIKVLPPEVAADAERRDRLVHEARAASALNHPSLLTVHDLGDENGTLYLAMELVEGGTLREWAREARAPLGVVRLARQAAQALAVAHGAGLVHRDLKPDNLMIRGDGLLKILDFGLARATRPGSQETMARTLPGTILGTAPYMSPEQVLGQPAGPPSDVFSIGIILYELLTRQHPFEAGSAVDTMHRILHETPAPPSLQVPSLPSELDFVVLKALAKEPDRRYATARELDVDLETCERALESRAAPAARGSTAAASAPRTLAVLPFKNIGGNPELNYLGVGLADAVITRLSTSPDLIVRATSSIARYENQAVDPAHVARDLEVGAVLDASFQRAGDRFRATARLVEAPSGQALWAGKVDLDFADIFSVQDEVANGIAAALTARLRREETSARKDDERRYTPGAEAYELYLRGTDAMREGTYDGFQRALAVAERAVKLDPDFADGWALLGRAHHSIADSGLDPDPSRYRKVSEALSRAIALEPEHAFAHFSRASLRLVQGKKRDAYAGMREAMTRLPNNWFVYHYLAYLFRLCSMYEEAVQADLRAHELDPIVPAPQVVLARLHFLRGDLAAAAQWVERVRARFPKIPQAIDLEMCRLRTKGEYEAALQVRASGDHVADTAGILVEAALALALLGRGSEARPMLAEIERAAVLDMDFAALAAAVRANLGDRDHAFDLLTRAAALGNDCLGYYENPQLFGPLYDDPRWEPFIAGVRGRVAEYRREFRWPPS